MRNRIKLTEDEIALGSWLYVILCIANNPNRNLRNVKELYQKAHDICWRNACLFCERYQDNFLRHPCIKCPLYRAELACGEDIGPDYGYGCDEGSWYNTVRIPYNTEKRIRAALNICEVFAQELKKVRDETTD